MCGDAHLSNFGVYASPERTLLFDLNDFDETLPGPFEYDVARLAASFVVAARDNGFSDADARSIATRSVASYREAMADFAQMRTLDVWYSRFDAEEACCAAHRRREEAPAEARLKGREDAREGEDEGQRASPLEADRGRDGQRRIVSDPPVIVPLRDLASTFGVSDEEVQERLHSLLRAYRSTLTDDRRRLLERFELVDVARKVVGVGSVGTRAWIALFRGRDDEDPLFLQVKQATRSVLEDHLPKSRYRQPGERVVQGQRMMQAASDIFLGWTKGVRDDIYYYWRQFRDMKGSAVIEDA